MSGRAFLAALAALYGSIAAYLGVLLAVTRARTLAVGASLFVLATLLAIIGWRACS